MSDNKCIICNKEVAFIGIFLCEEHTKKAIDAINGKTVDGDNFNVFKNPEFKHHCGICGKHESRIIVNYPDWLMLCNIDIKKAADAYKMDFDLIPK